MIPLVLLLLLLLPMTPLVLLLLLHYRLPTAEPWTRTRGYVNGSSTGWKEGGTKD